MKNAMTASVKSGVPAARRGTMTICMDPAYMNVPERKAHMAAYPEFLSSSPLAMPTNKYENNTGATFLRANLNSFSFLQSLILFVALI